MKIRNISLILMLLVFISCDDFLSKPPNKTSQKEPTKIVDLDRLLNNPSDIVDKNVQIIAGSDDYCIDKEMADHWNASDVIKASVILAATWDMGEMSKTSDCGFKDKWKRIYVLNDIFNEVDNVKGTKVQKNTLKAECCFLRAYYYLQMIECFCMPYIPVNYNTLGIPIKKDISYSENLSRNTLKKTWDFMISDLKYALENMNKPIERSKTGYRTYRVSKAAVDGLAARVYLTLGDSNPNLNILGDKDPTKGKNNYEKAAYYADLAIKGHEDLMLDYNTELDFDTKPVEVKDTQDKTINLHYSTLYAGNETLKTLEWDEFIFMRTAHDITTFRIPSKSLVSLYNKKYDLRFKYFYVDNYTYSIKSNIDWYGYREFNGSIRSGLTTAEMHLIKAECEARLGNVAGAMADINYIRKFRFDKNTPSDILNLMANSKDEALKLVLQERRREMPFSHRFADIKRFNNNKNDKDNVLLQRKTYKISSDGRPIANSLYTYTLSNNDIRLARPIPETDIDSSDGQIKQNKLANN